MRLYRQFLPISPDLRVGTWHIRRLVLHHHYPETTELHPHHHRHFQILCYLRGHGKIQIGTRIYAVQQGHVVLIPRELSHSFVRDPSAPPMCLVLDFDWRGFRHRAPLVYHANAGALHQIKRLLAEISRLTKLPPPPPALGIAAKVVVLQESLLQILNLVPSYRTQHLSLVIQKVNQLMDAMNSEHFSCKEIARQSGYQVDHLNRLFRRETGLTLGQFFSEKRLREAKNNLRTQSTISEAASLSGFEDPNYFSRWFKKLTGVSPREFCATA